MPFFIGGSWQVVVGLGNYLGDEHPSCLHEGGKLGKCRKDCPQGVELRTKATDQLMNKCLISNKQFTIG